MIQEFYSVNDDNDEGRPDGGYVQGVGLNINWQKGPLGRGDERVDANGAFVETVIAAVIQRIEYYQGDGKFACQENAIAIADLQHALLVLGERTARREAQGTEGTHEGN